MSRSGAIEATVDDFLKEMRSGSKTEYKRKLEVFHSYLSEKLDATNNNYFKIIESLKIDDIENSVIYYITGNGRRKISSCSPVLVFLSAVTEYLKFLLSDNKYDVKNQDLDSILKNNELRASVVKIMKDFDLKEPESENHLSEYECKQLLEKCREYFRIPFEALVENDPYNKSYRKFFSAILVRFVLVFGSSRETLNRLKLEDFNSELGLIKINGYTVRLPDDLIIQLRKYLMVRERIVVNRDKERLFVKRFSKTKRGENASSELDSATICVAMDDVFQKSSVVSIAKSAIISMIHNGAPQHLIMNFTGNKNDIYEYCLGVAIEESIAEDNRCLDRTLRSSRWFDAQ